MFTKTVGIEIWYILHVFRVTADAVDEIAWLQFTSADAEHGGEQREPVKMHKEILKKTKINKLKHLVYNIDGGNELVSSFPSKEKCDIELGHSTTA